MSIDTKASNFHHVIMGRKTFAINNSNMDIFLESVFILLSGSSDLMNQYSS